MFNNTQHRLFLRCACVCVGGGGGGEKGGGGGEKRHLDVKKKFKNN